MVPDMDSGLDIGTYRTQIGDQITAFADQLEAGDVRLSCDNYGRVHSPATNLPRSLRCCLSSSQGPLIGLDLSNSQPLFCGLVAQKYVNASKQARRKIRTWEPSSTPYDRQPKAASQPQCSITMAESAQPLVGKDSYGDRLRGPADLREYLDLSTSGRLYEALMPRTAERTAFKQAIFRDVFFGADRHPSAVRNAFADRFPTVAKVIAELKSDDYCRLAWLMQHQESSLFIGRVCRQLQRSRPTLPLATIHDAIVTTEEHLSFCRAVADEAFQKLGVTPTFKIEPWS